jgi:replication factor C subunit 2/4
MKVRVMELNASDERGIAVVREKIKSFAASSVGSAVGCVPPRRAAPRARARAARARHPRLSLAAPASSVPFKLIILDEADSLTGDAQAALRRTIETYSRVTRFCIICNYISRIIDPLASRCTKFRFKPLGRDAMVARLADIAAAEGVTAAPGALEAVLDVAGGDMRKAVTFLQSASELYHRDLTPERVVEISGIFPARELDAVLAALRRGGLDAARRAASAVIATGYAVGAVLERLADAVIAAADFPPAAKAAIVEKIAVAEKRLYDGADEELQLQDVFAHAARALAGTPIPADKERIVIM